MSRRFIESLVHPGDVAVDVGANIGYHTLIFARAVGERGRVFAYEPDPDNFRLLRRNVELNGYRNVRPFQAAVSDRSGTLTLYLSRDNPADHRAYLPADEARDGIAIDSYRLD